MDIIRQICDQAEDNVFYTLLREADEWQKLAIADERHREVCAAEAGRYALMALRCRGQFGEATR